MNRNKIFSSVQYTFLISLLLISHAFVGFSQETFPVLMELTTWKYSDNSREIIANLLTENDNGEFTSKGLSVNFFVQINDNRVEFTRTKTDENGQAIIFYSESFDFPKDEEGYIYIFAEFEGNDIYGPAEAELTFKDVLISMAFVEEDETKYIAFAGEVLGPDGQNFPLADDDIYFYVPRMFSYLKIADGWFEENGEGMVEYPTKIIGDSLGHLKVIARITEHYDYGNVEIFSETDWAIPSHLIAAEVPSRELWTPIAPLWMIVTLIIMLAGVWGHYFYAMYELYMIRKLGKRESKATNN